MNTEQKLQELRKEFEAKFAELENEVKKEEEKPYKRWRAERYRMFFFINLYGEVASANDSYDDVENYLFATGNYFETKEQAEKHRDKTLLLQEIADFADDQSWVDWEDHLYAKYIIVYDHDGIEWTYAKVHLVHGLNNVFFETEKHCKEAIEKFGERMTELLL